MKQEILCVMCFYNEEKNLASCIRHLAPFVDGFVLLDDASTDKSAEIASRTPRLRRLIRNESKDSWRERTNRERVLRAALECAETEEPWVLCVDADERFETRFLKDLPKSPPLVRERGKFFICTHVSFGETFTTIEATASGTTSSRAACSNFQRR